MSFSKGLKRLAKISVMTALFAGTMTAPTLFAEEDSLVINQFSEEIVTPIELQKQIEMNLVNPGNINTYDEVDVILDLIFNTGKQVWEIIKENQPVVDVKYDYANALPSGVRGASELDGWSGLQYQSFHVWGENGFGVKVYDLTYTVVHQYGGNYNGKGRYLETVSVIPQNLDVMWGYTFNFNTSKISVTNVGTKDDPVANIVMELTMKISTVVQKHEERVIFDIRGDSSEAKVIAN